MSRYESKLNLQNSEISPRFCVYCGGTCKNTCSTSCVGDCAGTCKGGCAKSCNKSCTLQSVKG